ncbi:hypothetical protein DITRI_Ditri14bG0125100 [Diplodiscus trichospermus]
MEGFAILLLCSFLFANLTISTAVDTLNATQLIRDGETIVSAGGRFELGFFSPGASRKKYLGIWYKKIPVKTAVWVANREVPLNDSSGALKLTNQGILVLRNHNGRTFWTSNSSRPARNPIAQLLDSGNLIVKEENDSKHDNFLWQSFDYPCDTLLQGMKIGRNLITGLDRNLSSWKSPDDPSPGNFTYGFELGGFPEVIMREGSVVQFRPGPWNCLRYSGTPELEPNSFATIIFEINKDEHSDVKLPDSPQSWFNYSMNLEEYCKNLCKRNCSCAAYSSLDIRNGGSGCMLWFVDLVDIQQFTENGQEIYARMAASDLGMKFSIVLKTSSQSLSDYNS